MGGRCSIADLALYGWIACHGWSSFAIEEFPQLKEPPELMKRLTSNSDCKDKAESVTISRRCQELAGSRPIFEARERMVSEAH